MLDETRGELKKTVEKNDASMQSADAQQKWTAQVC
jgi:hypothetical protein